MATVEHVKDLTRHQSAGCPNRWPPFGQIWIIVIRLNKNILALKWLNQHGVDISCLVGGDINEMTGVLGYLCAHVG